MSSWTDQIKRPGLGHGALREFARTTTKRTILRPPAFVGQRGGGARPAHATAPDAAFAAGGSIAQSAGTRRVLRPWEVAEMARSRNIKPSIMENEELAELPPVARLLFIYLWMLADREGRLEDRPRRIAGRALPYDREVDVDDLLNKLAGAGFITRYMAGEMALIQIINFTKHQSPHVRETASELPSIEQGTAKAVTKHNLGSAEASPRSPDSLFPLPDSLLPCSDADASVVASNALAPCPHKEIIALFADQLPELSQPRVWNSTRERNLANRWKWVLADQKKKGKPFDKEAGLDFFRRMFGYVAKCDFLMGKTKDWSCSLPWIVKEENFARIIEGDFDPKVAA